MPYIAAQDVNNWFDGSKMQYITGVPDPALEKSIAAQIFAVVGRLYSSSSWVSDATTPSLIRSLIGMYYAGTMYQRAYAEDTGIDVGDYGTELINRALELAEKVADGSLLLFDSVGEAIAQKTKQPSFEKYEDDPKFLMGMIF